MGREPWLMESIDTGLFRSFATNTVINGHAAETAIRRALIAASV